MEAEIKEVPGMLVASKRDKGKYQEVIPRLLKELFSEVKDNCAGAPVFICHDEEPKEIGDIECAVPIKEKAEFPDNTQVKELPGGQFAQLLYEGPYGEGCSAAYGALLQFIKENGLEVMGPSREVYLNDPAKVKPEELQTLIQYPVK